MLSQKFISVQIRAELIPCGWPGRGGGMSKGGGRMDTVLSSSPASFIKNISRWALADKTRGCWVSTRADTPSADDPTHSRNNAIQKFRLQFIRKGKYPLVSTLLDLRLGQRKPSFDAEIKVT